MIHTDKTVGQVQLREIVLDVVEDINVPHRFYKNLLRWAIRGCADLHLFHLDYYEEAKLTPNDLNIINVPDDFVNLVALGFNWKGRFWRLTKDNRFITTTTTDGSETLDEDSGEGVAIGDGSIYHLGESGGKNQYYFSWINATQFMINGTPRVEVILRYVSSGVNQRGTTYVPAICREVLIAYVKSMYYEKIKAPAFDRQKADQKYDEELNKLTFAQSSSIEDIADAVYESWTQAVKR